MSEKKSVLVLYTGNSCRSQVTGTAKVPVTFSL